MNARSARSQPACRIIGWDAAVDPRNNALAVGDLGVEGGPEETVRTDGGERGPDGSDDARVLTVRGVVSPANDEAIAETVTEWIGEVSPRCPILLCIDAPLGWPARLGPTLANHTAGAALDGDAERLFRRATDRDIRRRLGKTPLDVGADRIARTAYSVLGRIEALRRRVTREIRLALGRDAVRAMGGPTGGGDEPADCELPIWLVESYPAAWFVSEGIDTKGYRPRRAGGRRGELFREVLSSLGWEGSRGWRIAAGDRIPEDEITRTADTLDAVACVYNGADVWWCDNVPEPENREAARIEGWIWCKSPG